MKPTNFKVFDRRSIYSHRRCIRLSLDLEGYAEITTNEFANFNEKLLGLLPDLGYHRCSTGAEGGFRKILEAGTCLHHVCGHIAIALQNIVGVNVSFCSQSKHNSRDSFTVYEFKYKNTGVEAGNIAVEIINSLVENKPLYLPDKLGRLEKTLQEELKKTGTFPASSEDLKYQVPIVAITGTNGKTTTTRLIAYAISKAGYRVGMTTTDGIYINGRCVYEGDTTGPRSAHMVLANNEIDVAVLETARGGMVRNGLAYDLADVAVITNITDDHLGLDGIENMEDLAVVKALVGEAVKPDGFTVINGDDPFSISIVNRLKRRLIVFSEDGNNEVLRAAVRSGGYGIYISEGQLFIENEISITLLMPIADIGITFNGVLKYNIQNAMAACGALIGFGIANSIIKDSLKDFQCNEELNPGRFNVFEVNGVSVILDYGHNIDGYKSVLAGLTRMKHNNLIGIIGVPGDRLDRTTIEVGKIAGSCFHRILIKEDKDRRGRLPGEVAELLKKGVLTSGFDASNLEIILDEVTALETALESAKQGDMVIIFFEEYAPLLKLVKNRISSETREVVAI